MNIDRVVYVYLLKNKKFILGYTDRSFLLRTVEHKNDGMEIERVLTILHLKSNSPSCENPRSLESKLHFSLAANIGVPVKQIAETGLEGFAYDIVDLYNVIMSVEDTRHYNSISAKDLSKINTILSMFGVLAPKS